MDKKWAFLPLSLAGAVAPMCRPAKFDKRLFFMREADAHAATGYAPSPRPDSLPKMNPAIGTTSARSSHEARGTTRNTKPIFALGCPKATSP